MQPSALRGLLIACCLAALVIPRAPQQTVDVVVLGEAAMLSAQILKSSDNGQPREIRFGMNVPGFDDRQFALNTMHWLSHALN